ncbi:PP2C family serine/threonine-protein phosphatase [Akkermansia sp. N21169]|uniref:PP2C family serine/threonine-protein phosphatase n=1 Tax=Akkermansia sp. N21169 TaxID=3040765 RepID=UPI00244E95BE|nr:PP2C family serine/threonine-protein phosphatase [Akkermansia sp. N21169]MDH3068511.1 PP2C family serine/threonine-protein phosphatase [Akkermansia sp. N21169]
MNNYLDIIKLATVGELNEYIIENEIFLTNTLSAFVEKIRNRVFMEQKCILEQYLESFNFSLPNARVAQDYQYQLESIVFKDYEIVNMWVLGLEGTGLSYNPDTGVISGQASEAGEISLTLYYQLDVEDEEHTLSRSLILVVNPDPRDLWKDIPTPSGIPYYKPDFEKCFIPRLQENGKNMVAASLRGRSHAHVGKARDDHFAMKFCEKTGWYILAVADGAGSAEYSRRGSQIACDVALTNCAGLLENDDESLSEKIHVQYHDPSQAVEKSFSDALYYLLGKAAFNAYKSIEEEASSQAIQTREFATTILITIAKKFDFGWFVASFWVGDGALAIYRRSEDTTYLKIMGKPDGGEFAGQTRFLTMKEIMYNSQDIIARLKFDFIEDFTAVILMTDGISDPKFETDANLEKPKMWDDLWSELLAEVPQLAGDKEDPSDALLKWLLFWSQGNHDDRTIAILY